MLRALTLTDTYSGQLYVFQIRTQPTSGTYQMVGGQVRVDGVVSVTSRTLRALDAAASRRIAASSVASVATGYECSLRPCTARFSPPQSTNCTRGDAP